MSNIQTGADSMQHDLSHLGFLAGCISRPRTFANTNFIVADYSELDDFYNLHLSPLRTRLAIFPTAIAGVDLHSGIVRIRRIAAGTFFTSPALVHGIARTGRIRLPPGRTDRRGTAR